MAKTILITGVAGFIGSHMAEALLARGERVVGLDDLNDYYAPSQKRRNLELVAASGGPGWTFIEGDVRDGGLLGRVFAEADVDAVIHLAAMAGVRASIENPNLYLDVNVIGTQRLLDACVEHGTSHVVLASTSSVYGPTTTIPFVETDPCDRPLAPYATSKRAAEMLGYTYHHLHGLSVTALRFFTVYGPRNRPDMMAYKVLDSICYGTEVPLYAGGQMKRDWTYVLDVVGGVLAALDRPLGFETLNLGRGEPILLADFVRCLEDLVGKRANLRPADRPGTDVLETWASLDRTRDRLGYSPSTSVDVGTRALWEWFEAEVLSAR